nr:hypothetical protein [Oceanococcus sp. HetDA_MAG_MS8]
MLSHAQLWAFHTAFGVFCGLALWWQPLPYGQLLLGLVVGYSIAMALFTQFVGASRAFQLWLFLLPLSALMILPDWWLSSSAGVLRFMPHGVPYVGAVPIYMGLMWVIPLFVCLHLARPAQAGAALRAAGWALVIFGLAELAAPHLQIWAPQGVTGVAGTALYILPAEAWLGAATCMAWQAAGQAPWPGRLSAGLAVMLSYVGAAALSLMLLEPLLRAWVS